MGNLPSFIAPNVDLTPYECPICFDCMTPPYFQCTNGHIICNECLTKLDDCPVCKGPKPNIRNRVLENIVDPLLTPCEFQSCTEKFFKQELQIEHVKDCDSRPNPVTCQLENCQWNGNLSELVSHMISVHQNIASIQGDSLSVPYPASYYETFAHTRMQKRFDSDFIVTLMRRPWDLWTRCYLIVQVVGNRKHAKKFTYNATLRDNSTTISWQSNMNSILENVGDIIYKGECFSFSTQQGLKFTKNGNLNISFTLQRK